MQVVEVCHNLCFWVFSKFWFCQALNFGVFSHFNVLVFVTIWFFEICHNFFFLLSSLEFLSFVTIWVFLVFSRFRFCHNFSFFHSFSFWVFFQFEILSFLIVWVFEFFTIGVLSCVPIWVLELSQIEFLSFLTNSVFKFCHNLSFRVVPQLNFMSSTNCGKKNWPPNK